jgi:hypothetical protein
MDRITKSLISEMLTNQEITSQSESKDFEKLVNYCVISNEYSKTFELDLVTVGDGSDTGIDGIAIIVNGQLIENKEEIDDLFERNNVLEVSYVFIQAKTSSNFSSGDLNTFIFGVKDFFSESPSLVRNEDIKKFAELSDHLYKMAPHFKENPILKLYFCTTGKWQDDRNLKGVIDQGVNDLEQFNLFHSHPIGFSQK